MNFKLFVMKSIKENIYIQVCHYFYKGMYLEMHFKLESRNKNLLSRNEEQKYKFQIICYEVKIENLMGGTRHAFALTKH